MCYNQAHTYEHVAHTVAGKTAAKQTENTTRYQTFPLNLCSVANMNAVMHYVSSAARVRFRVHTRKCIDKQRLQQRYVTIRALSVS
jgi:hypothetical protein